jgi:hypothetical protein
LAVGLETQLSKDKPRQKTMVLLCSFILF